MGTKQDRRHLRHLRVEGIRPVSHETIHRILIEGRLNDPIPRPRRAWGKHRFERPHSNGLWRADFKLTEQDESMITFLDDHSHFVPDSRVHHNPTEEHAIKLLEESMRRYRKPKPEQILIDRGSHFNPA